MENIQSSIQRSKKLDQIETVNESSAKTAMKTNLIPPLASETFSLVSSSGVGSSIHTDLPTEKQCSNKNSILQNAPRVIFDTTSINIKLNDENNANKPRSSSIISKSSNSNNINNTNKAATSTSHRKTSNSMQPFNSRIRSAFEIFRNTFNYSSSSSSNSLSNKKIQEHKKSTTKSITATNNVRKSSTNKENLNVKSSNTQIEISNSSKVINSNNYLSLSTNPNVITCQLCFNECSKSKKFDQDTNYMYQIQTCEHSFCFECLRQYLKYQIIESRVSIACPQCNEKMHPSDIYNLLSVNTHLKNNYYNNIKNEEEIVVDDLNDSLASSSTSNSTSSTKSSPNNSNKSLIDSEEIKIDEKLNKNKNNNNNNIKEQKIKLDSKEQDWPLLIQKYEEFMLRRVLVTIPDTRWCPAPDCTYAVIASGCANCPQLFCQRPNCNTSFCYHCKQVWHPNLTCEDAAIRNNQSTIGTFLTQNSDLFIQDLQASTTTSNKLIRSLLQRSNSHISTTSSNNLNTIGLNINNNNNNGGTILTTSKSATGDLIKEEIKRCPKCQALIVKMDDGSCNHITCSVCGCEFCWLCMKEISDLHYLSPSGCTFWGKKPWSRKKKILWQLGTLIGAPVGIALIAGVAVPSILIGLPIWSGRKVYLRYKTMGRHKRNLIVVGTVFGAIIVAPLVAALAVGIGVPILLAYVYGVVPISLCRNGGCGVITNNNGGVRFAFDDENNETNSNYFNINSLTNVPATTSKKSENNKSIKKNESNNINSCNNNNNSSTVTIPISAAGIDLIRSDSNNNNNSSKDLNKTDLVTSNNGFNNKYNINNNNNDSDNNNNAQTPVLVTITMATKSSKNYSSDLNSKKNNNNKHSKSKKPSNKSSSRINKHSIQFISNSECNNSVTTACGTVEANNLNSNFDNNEDILIFKQKVSNVSSLSSPVGDAETLSGTAISTIKRLNILIENDNTNMVNGSNNNSKSVNSFKIVSETNAKSSIKKCNSNNNYKKNKNNINNPSIGDISIGAYTTSFSASLSGSNLYEDEVDDDENNNSVESSDNCSENDQINYVEDKNDNSNTNANENNSKMDRDSASNIALAGSSIKSKMTSIYNSNYDDNESRQILNNEKLDVKSTTLSTYSDKLNNPNINNNKNDTYSISMISQKSVNPSIMALAGSVKDNQSVSNFSNN